MRILFVIPYIPSLVRVRPYNLIRALAAHGHQLHLVLLRPPEDRAVSIDSLQTICEAVEVFPLSRSQTLLNAALALPIRIPLQAAYSHQPEAERHLQTLIASNHFDVVHLEHLCGAVLADSLKDIPIIFDSVDSISYLFEQVQQHAPNWRSRLMAFIDLARTRHYEAQLPQRFTHTLVTSPIDKRAFVQLNAANASKITVLPNGVDLNYFQPTITTHDPATILFSGKLSYHANVAAALFLAQHIMPLVWEKRADAHLTLVGKDPAPALRALTVDPRVTVTGYLPDLRPYFARATVAAAPLRYGAGVQNKVLEAMATGLPVVATPQVLGALQAEPGHHFLIGDSPQQLANHLLTLIKQPTLRQSLSEAGRQYVETHHNWAVIASELTRIYQSTI